MDVLRTRILAALASLALSAICFQMPINLQALPPAWAELGTSTQIPLADRAYQKAEWVFDHASDVQYRHYKHDAAEQVHDENGRTICHNDCSGFVSYVIHAVAPRHYKPIRERQSERPYPQAKIFAHFFGSLESDSPKDGWLRVPSFRDLRRGDFIAWEKGASNNDHGGKGNSGHVMLVRDQPGEPYTQEIAGKRFRLVNVPVIDSSSVYHFPPETLPPQAGQEHRNGLGKGEVKLVLDEDGKPIGYWEGSFWGEGNKDLRHPSMSTVIHFGRMVDF